MSEIIKCLLCSSRAWASTIAAAAASSRVFDKSLFKSKLGLCGVCLWRTTRTRHTHRIHRIIVSFPTSPLLLFAYARHIAQCILHRIFIKWNFSGQKMPLALLYPFNREFEMMKLRTGHTLTHTLTCIHLGNDI